MHLAEQAIADLDARLEHWRAPADRRVRLARDDVKLLVEFVLGTINEELLSERVKRAVRSDERYVAAFARIHAAVEGFDACVVAIDQALSKDALVEKLVSAADRLRSELEAAVTAFITIIDTLVHTPELTLKCLDALHFARGIQSRIEARRLMRDVEQIIGDVAADSVGRFYHEYAIQEGRHANWLRAAVAGLFAVLTGGAILLYVWVGAGSASAELARLSMTLPIAALAAYLMREASKHRSNAFRARELAIAMHTLRGYTALFPDGGLELWRALGLRVFAGSENRPSATDVDVEGNPSDPGSALGSAGQVLPTLTAEKIQ
jgi:hypothetical protein